MKVYDAVVVGLGAVGSAAFHQLANRTQSVLGIDTFQPPHGKGSSGGGTRAIRMAYFEDPRYVPLLRRAYELWERLEAESATRLFARTGIVQFSPEVGAVAEGILTSAKAHRLHIERFEGLEAAARFQMFNVPAELTGYFESNAGYLLSDAAIDANLQIWRLARGHG